MKFLKTAVLLLASLAAATLLAQQPQQQYDVEIIVVRHLEPDSTELALAEEDADSTPVRRRRYPALDAGQLRLGGATQRLLSSSEWSPVLHAGWRQPAEPRDDAAAMSVAGTRRGTTVRGTVRVSRDRFLRMEVDLDLEDGAGERFRINQARRIRSGEVHYFDHPQFGIIATVNPAP